VTDDEGHKELHARLELGMFSTYYEANECAKLLKLQGNPRCFLLQVTVVDSLEVLD
jgi:hypothetical protein